MPSDAQIKFFDKLLEEKDFSGGTVTDPDTLKKAFSQLNIKSASAWIDAAMKLPKRDETDEPLVEAPF
jgi:hypothetical protein